MDSTRRDRKVTIALMPFRWILYCEISTIKGCKLSMLAEYFKDNIIFKHMESRMLTISTRAFSCAGSVDKTTTGWLKQPSSISTLSRRYSFILSFLGNQSMQPALTSLSWLVVLCCRQTCCGDGYEEACVTGIML